MRPLPTQAGLAEIQRYVAEMETERGFADSPVLEQCLKLGEEYGELCKAVRKSSGLPIEAGSTTSDVGDELADLLIYLCAVANRLNIDLDHALRTKERVNETRTWSREPEERTELPGGFTPH
ncbi:MazG nucleotide pyrophosphohydrolase domain-containing protein [Actinopolyspora mortivallis]|uniref:Pyrophosphohydrolase n=1 Tax=Actinopolyspora mortivallis TaxID=33906 RepID=A0A2T0GVF9_ACTMO|nr:MazG nucleotide pyrophosphohydrolase domain-containing protein [Actinopolyspora mortivallis]PRW63106.1 pyrophosphohydrolase [Actinopolyspora mortivallis]